MNIGIHRVESIKEFNNTHTREDGTFFYVKTLRVEDDKGAWHEITLYSDKQKNLEIK